MTEQVWIIEARFKSVGGPWIVQLSVAPFMTAEDAETKVEQYRKRNTLSEWRARMYVPGRDY